MELPTDAYIEEATELLGEPAETIFKTGTNPVLLLRELAEMGDCHVAAHTD